MLDWKSWIHSSIRERPVGSIADKFVLHCSYAHKLGENIAGVGAGSHTHSIWSGQGVVDPSRLAALWVTPGHPWRQVGLIEPPPLITSLLIFLSGKDIF